MNRNDLFSAMEFIDEKIIENSEVKRTVKFQKKFSRRTIMLVAVIGLITIFTTAVFAANLFGLRDALINSNDPEIKSEMSLSGFTDSKEYKAAAEWKAFADSYDPDGSILAQAIQEGSDAELDEKYDHYPVYTQEMADKIDEIAAKYGLTLHGSLKDMALEDWNTVVGKFVITDYDHEEFSDDAYSSILGGYMYDNGTFRYDGIFNATAGRLSVDYQFSRTAKGVFDPVFLNIGDIEDYQEQVITTDSGISLVAAISGYKSVLITEFESCFVAINVMGGTDMGITFDDLKDLANTFDFSVIKNVKSTSSQGSTTTQPVTDPTQNTTTPPEANVSEIADGESEWEQGYIEVTREGVTEKIPVETVRVVNFDTTIATYREYFTHSVCENVDTFSCDAWEGNADVYYSVYEDESHTAEELAGLLQQYYTDSYRSVNSEKTRVGGYDAFAVYLDVNNNVPDYNMHYFIIPTDSGCIVIESQFSIEMYEGLYQIMRALFDTIKIG
ncbi:MAG: hypothetical protein IJP10_01510 [Clostridia bacterium]|nr:hypothetical protein [Clostridia bacterium]